MGENNGFKVAHSENKTAYLVFREDFKCFKQFSLVNSIHGPIHLDCFRQADVVEVEVNASSERNDGQKVDDGDSDFADHRRNWLVHNQRPTEIINCNSLETPVHVYDGCKGEKRVGDGMIGHESYWEDDQSHDRHDPLRRPMLRCQHTTFAVKPGGS